MLEVIKRIEELNGIDRKSIFEVALKFSEEAGEVANAVLVEANSHGLEYKSGTTSIPEEIADAFICSMSLLLKTGYTFSNFIDCVDAKIDKWESKILNV